MMFLTLSASLCNRMVMMPMMPLIISSQEQLAVPYKLYVVYCAGSEVLSSSESSKLTIQMILGAFYVGFFYFVVISWFISTNDIYFLIICVKVERITSVEWRSRPLNLRNGTSLTTKKQKITIEMNPHETTDKCCSL